MVVRGRNAAHGARGHPRPNVKASDTAGQRWNGNRDADPGCNAEREDDQPGARRKHDANGMGHARGRVVAETGADPFHCLAFLRVPTVGCVHSLAV